MVEKYYKRLEGFVTVNIRPDDVLLTDAYTFLNAKRVSPHVHSYKKIDQLDSHQRQRIYKVIFSETSGSDGYELDELLELLGGSWRLANSYIIGRSNLRQKFFATPK